MGIRIESMLRRLSVFVPGIFLIICLIGTGFAQDIDSSAPVSFDSENLYYDDEAEIVIATGNVRLEQLGRVVTADKIVYSINDDLVVANGNVTLTETDGTKYYSEEVQFTDRMREGYVLMLRGKFPDGSRFSADMARRYQSEDRGDEIVMDKATYTACKPCAENPEAPPAWELKANRVTHHRDQNRISYNNAVLQLGGYSVLWVPYFSHPDGSIEQKSGFINPTLGFDSELGTTLGSEYYYAIAPDKDATIGVTAFSKENPMLSGQYRQRFNDAEMSVTGSITNSSRFDQVSGQRSETEKETRGHLFGNARWDINDKWRAGADIQVSSDDQYLRQYDISDEDILENEIYAERFEGRDYIVARGLSFQDVRVLEDREDQPDILPELEVSYLGQPDNLIGGRWAVDLSALGLQREGADQDLGRMSANLGWQRSETSDLGFVSTLDLSTRGDIYYVSDRDLSRAPGETEQEDTVTRIYPNAHFETRYPFAKSLENSSLQAVIEPVTSLTFAPEVSGEDEIPNEDSQDAQVDANNIFNANRFPGYDRVEDRSRITYGLRSGLYAGGGSQIYGFIGQSHYFEDEENPFPEGSGLSDKNSDIVAEVRARYRDKFEVNYRTQFADHGLSSRRHELDAAIMTKYVDLQGLYFFTKSLEGTTLRDSREQTRGAARFHLSDTWSFTGGATYDLGDDPGLREADFGAEYLGQCISIALTAERNLTDEVSGDAGTEFFIRLGLKNLGNFQTSGISFNSENE